MAMKQTPGIKRKETNMTADSARRGNLMRVASKAAAKSPTAQKIKDAKLNATSKKVARDADSVNISDYKVQGTRTAIRGRMAADRAKTAGRAKNVEMKLKKAAAKKATAKKAK
jgi:CRISPR/Cas system-associated exonuclease Cas4 (RecB family)